MHSFQLHKHWFPLSTIQMFILAQSKFPSGSHYHYSLYRHSPFPRARLQILFAATTTITKPNSSHEKLVAEPGLRYPVVAATAIESNPIYDKLDTETELIPHPTIVSTSPMYPILNDPSLQSKWSHRAWVASGCITLAISLAKSIIGSINSHLWLEPILAGPIGYILADLGSGVYHWGIDNYGSASTPIFGAQIEAFHGHHKWPWIITRREFANNLHALARAVTFTVLPIDLACDDPVVHGFVCMCAGCIMFSQQFHAWSHGTKSKLPPLVVALQDAGVLVSRSQHAVHHRAPCNNNYCIVSGICNEILDKHKVFDALELIFFFKMGVRPRSWSEPSSEWTEESENHVQNTAH